jgi:hypothetical protein
VGSCVGQMVCALPGSAVLAEPLSLPPPLVPLDPWMCWGGLGAPVGQSPSCSFLPLTALPHLGSRMVPLWSAQGSSVWLLQAWLQPAPWMTTSALPGRLCCPHTVASRYFREHSHSVHFAGGQRTIGRDSRRRQEPGIHEELSIWIFTNISKLSHSHSHETERN